MKSLEARVAFLHEKAQLHKKLIPQDAAVFLASTNISDTRELGGLLIKLIAISNVTQRELDLSFAKEFVGEHLYNTTKSFN